MLASTGKLSAWASDESADSIDFFERLTPKDSTGYCSRGTVRSRVGDLAGAKADFERAIELEPKNAEAYSGRGYLRIYLADNKGALEDFQKAIELDPNSAASYCGRGQALSELGEEKDALADFDRAIKLDPKNAQAYIFRGYHLGRHGEKWLAIADYDQTIKLDPNNALAYCYRGFALESIKNPQKAIADFEQVIKFDPQYAWAYYRRGQSREAVGDRKGAMLDFNKYIQLAPKDPWGFRARGFIKQETGDKKGAITDYSKAINLDPKDPWTFSARGFIRFKIGDSRGSIKDYKQASRLERKKEPEQKVDSPTPAKVELMENADVYNFATKTLIEAEKIFGKPAIPVKQLLIFQRPGTRCQTIVMDEDKGIFCVFISCKPDSQQFQGNLGHELMHLLNAKLFDPYVEGLCSLYGERAITGDDPKSNSDRTAFKKLVLETPFYSETYLMLKEIEDNVDADHFKKFLDYAVYDRGHHWMHIDIDKWLSSLSQEERDQSMRIIQKYSDGIERTMQKNGAYTFVRPKS